MKKTIRKQLDQGHKTQFSLLVKANTLKLPVDIRCNLFDKLVFPIMQYGCEIWGVTLRIFWKYFTGNLSLKTYISDHPHPAPWYMVRLVNYHSM